MARTPAWQSRFERFDYSDFAQEFLRRNPVYREQYTRFAGAGEGTARSLAEVRAARSWGLEFPVRSGPRCSDRTRVLVGVHQSQRRGHLPRSRSLGSL